MHLTSHWNPWVWQTVLQSFNTAKFSDLKFTFRCAKEQLFFDGTETLQACYTEGNELAWAEVEGWGKREWGGAKKKKEENSHNGEEVQLAPRGTSARLYSNPHRMALLNTDIPWCLNGYTSRTKRHSKSVPQVSGERLCTVPHGWMTLDQIPWKAL